MDKQESIKIKELLEKKEIDEILTRKVSQYGSSGKVGIPKKHIGKETIIIIKKNITVN